MEGVIPNSRVVIMPPSPPNTGDWRKELYLRPGDWIPWVTLTVIVATIILAITVFFLHLNERVRVKIIYPPHGFSPSSPPYWLVCS